MVLLDPGLVTLLVLGLGPVTAIDFCVSSGTGESKFLEVGALAETPGPGPELEMWLLESGGSVFLITETLFIAHLITEGRGSLKGVIVNKTQETGF